MPRLLAVLCLLLSATAAAAFGTTAPRFQGSLAPLHLWEGKALVVITDPGGGIEEREAEIRELRQKGTHIRIVGLCASACTMYLGLPHACVEPGAVLMFHGAQMAFGNPPVFTAPMQDPMAYPWATRIAIDYPDPLRSWFMAEGRHGDHWITGLDAIKLGVARCA